MPFSIVPHRPSLMTRSLGIGTTGAALWMLQNSLQARSERVDTAHNQNDNATMMDTALYNQTAYSGNGMDDMAVGVHNLQNAINNQIYAVRVNSEYLFRDVIGANLPWLGLALAGLWLGAGDWATNVGRSTWRTAQPAVTTLWGGTVRALNRPAVMNAGSRTLRRGLLGVSQTAVRNLPATVVAGLALWYFASQLQSTVNGEAQQEFFREAFLDGATGRSATFSFNPYDAG